MSPRTNDSPPESGRPADGRRTGDRPAEDMPAPGTGPTAEDSATDESVTEVVTGDSVTEPVTGGSVTGSAHGPAASVAGGAAESSTDDRGEPADGGSPEPATDATTAAATQTPVEEAPSASLPGAPAAAAAEPLRRRVLRLTACAAALAVAITCGAVVMGALNEREQQSVSASTAPGVTEALIASGDLDAGITALQNHLRDQPRDHGSWATLGLAYIEQARTKGDPSRYPQAEKALKRSLRLRPGNDPALAGQAALAAARHDFKGALAKADLALKENPYSERALSTRIDALVELGRYDEALKAAETADSRRPGIPVFTRYAYVYELRGDTKTAERVLKQALSSAATAGDIAYVATQLGQLAWRQGDYETALGHYARALAADDEYVPALEGRARAQSASGDREGAIRTLEQVVAHYPLPGPLVELGELYEVEGDEDRAREQYALVDAWTAIARANGVNADLDTALAAADHGGARTALSAARADWERRQTVHTADALAWALHVNGKDEEALPYARRAAATGYRDAAFLYHRGIIEKATDNEKEARRSLKAALDLNPGFSPLGAQRARAALKVLEAAK